MDEDLDVRRSDMPTAPLVLAPVVLAVGCAAELVVRCREAAIKGQALLTAADVASAATIAAELRPLVIVVHDDVYAFDARSFDELGADVGARVVTVGDDLAQETLEARIVEAILEAEQARDQRS